MEEKLKHLEFIQGVITRMNSNSFSIKTWMVTIIAAFLAMYASDGNNTTYLLIAVIPTCAFWLLDTYYLAMERQYRKLYNEVRSGENYNLDMSAKKFPLHYISTLFRPVEVGVYLPIILLLILAWYFL